MVLARSLEAVAPSVGGCACPRPVLCTSGCSSPGCAWDCPHLTFRVCFCDAPGMWLRCSFLWVTLLGQGSAHQSDKAGKPHMPLRKRKCRQGSLGAIALLEAVGGHGDLGPTAGLLQDVPLGLHALPGTPGLLPGAIAWGRTGCSWATSWGRVRVRPAECRRDGGPAGVSGLSVSSCRSVSPAPACPHFYSSGLSIGEAVGGNLSTRTPAWRPVATWSHPSLPQVGGLGSRTGVLCSVDISPSVQASVSSL